MKFLRYTLSLLLLGSSCFGLINAATNEGSLTLGVASGALHGALTIPSSVFTGINTASKALADTTNKLWELAEQAASENPGYAAYFGYLAGLTAGHLAVDALLSQAINSLIARGMVAPVPGQTLKTIASTAGFFGSYAPAAYNRLQKYVSETD